MSKLERKGFSSLSRPTEPADARKLDKPEPRTTANESVEFSKSKESAEQEAREAQERAEKAAREKLDKDARRRAERETAKKAVQEAQEKAEAVRAKAEEDARQRAEKEVEEQAERDAQEKGEQEARENADREAKERTERKKERLEREEKERVEREEKEKAEREAKERGEEERNKVPVSKIPSAWGSTIGKSDCSKKTSALSQKERKNELANGCDFGPTQKEEPSDLPPITTSSAPGGIFGGAGNFDFFAAGEKDPPGGAEEVEFRTPLTKKGKKGVDGPSSRSKVTTPTVSADAGRLDMLEDLNMNIMSARVSISSENERFTDTEQELSPTEPTHPVFAPETASEALLSTTPERLLETPKEVKEEVPTTPKPWPTLSLTPTHRSQVPTPAPVPAKTEPKKPLSLWDRKRLGTATPPAPTSSLFGGNVMNSSGVLGVASDGGRNAESVAMPTLVGDRQSVFTDTAHDQKRENQWEGVADGLLGSNLARRRNDSAQSRMTTKPAPRPAPTPVPASQRSGGWGSWGSSLLNNIANVVTAERTPSPEPPPVRPKIGYPSRGFAPSQPPGSEPTRLSSLNKTTGNMIGSGGTTRGTGPASGPSTDKNLTVDNATKPLESSPNTAEPENVPESAVEIRLVPAPGVFNRSITDKEVAGDAQGDALESSGTAGTNGLRDSKLPSPIREKVLGIQIEETEEPVKTEETATPAEEDELDWANQGKKKSLVVSFTHTPSAPNTPDPDNVDDGPAGGGGGNKKKKKKGRK